MTTNFILPDYTFGNSKDVQDQMIGVLQNLEQALEALEPAPNATTVKFNDAVLVSATVGEEAILTPSGLTFNTLANPTTIQNSGGYDLTIASSSQLVLNSYDNVNINAGVGLLVNASDYISMTANNDSITFQADDNISLTSVGLGDINISAPNINCFGYSLPICFDFVELDRQYVYNSGGQQWELIWIQTINVPYQLFTETPQIGYTSSRWRIDFTINTWSNAQNNTSDKARAFYIDFQDQASTFYPTTIFTSSKPYCYHNQNSTWNGGASLSEFIPQTWTDYIDFSALAGTGSGNVPLKVNVYFSADNPKNFEFSYKLGLTRTNVNP